VNKLLRHFYFILSVFLVFGTSEGSRASPPLPQSKVQALDSLEVTLDKQKQEQHILKSEMQTLEIELNKTRTQLIEKAQDIQKNETILKKLEDRIFVLESDKTAVESSIREDRRSIGQLVIALERLRRLPPEVIIARPDAPINTARSSMLMSEIVPILTRRAEKLRHEVVRLQDVHLELEKKRTMATTNSALLSTQYEKMSTLMRTRATLYNRTCTDYKIQEKRVLHIAEQAKTLKDLMAKLNQSQQETKKNIANNIPLHKPLFQKKVNNSISLKRGNQLPVSGVILVRYGETDHFGAKSKGIRIEARSRALVVAPMNGIIRFAGKFKNYGNMVIIEHKNGYHSLVAGLKKIDTVVGQSIVSGEPIGQLHQSDRKHKPILYYELRFKGNAVNPANKFSELS